MKLVSRARFLVLIPWLATALACGGGGGAKPGAPAEGEPASKASKAAPELSLQDLDGKTVRLSDSAGTVRLISFWATWCAPCRAEIPTLKAINATYGPKGLTLLAISMDQDGTSLVRSFAKENGIDYRVLIGNDETAEAFGGIGGLPTTFFLDREGKVVDNLFGEVPKGILTAKIEELLAAK